MKINEIRCYQSGSDEKLRHVYVMLEPTSADVCVRFRTRGYNLPQVSLLSWKEAAAAMTVDLGNEWENIPMTSMPSDLGTAPTGELPDPLGP